MPVQTSLNLGELLRLLNAATDNNALHWADTADEDTFRAELGLGLVRISQLPPKRLYTLSLLDEDGLLLDQYEPVNEEELHATDMLYKKARRQALKLERKLTGVYKQLKALAGES